MRKTRHFVRRVEEGSIAQELEISAGDELLAINGSPVRDIIDYRYLCSEEKLTVLIRKPDREEWELDIEKEYEEDLGIEFENDFMDDYHACCNRCIFCFIDQMPPGMRDTLYFKDDDSRLSFLQGNYVTLTNLDEEDMEQIIRYHLSPINISFHTMNPQLRCRMLNNRFAGEALKKAERFREAGIAMNGQIVLCKGINDGEELCDSIEKLSSYFPHLQSVSVVPVGLTRYREGLYPLQPFEKEDAKAVLKIIRRFQETFYRKYGNHFVHAGDEWYLLAGEDLPPQENYDGYPQLENGVGMLRLFLEEAREELQGRAGDEREHTVSVATGLLAAPYLRQVAEQICRKYPNVQIRIYPVENKFFGERITVSGLLTGRDLREQLQGAALGERLLLPCSMFRSGEDVFLDDMTLVQLEDALQTRACIVKSSGKDFVRAALLEAQREESYVRAYEVTED